MNAQFQIPQAIERRYKSTQKKTCLLMKNAVKKTERRGVRKK